MIPQGENKNSQLPSANTLVSSLKWSFGRKEASKMSKQLIKIFPKAIAPLFYPTLNRESLSGHGKVLGKYYFHRHSISLYQRLHLVFSYQQLYFFPFFSQTVQWPRLSLIYIYIYIHVKTRLKIREAWSKTSGGVRLLLYPSLSSDCYDFLFE